MTSRLAVLLLMVASSAAAQQVPQGIAVPITFSANYDPTLSPDGKRMLFIKALEGHEQFFMADSDGRHERQITRDGERQGGPSLVP